MAERIGIQAGDGGGIFFVRAPQLLDETKKSTKEELEQDAAGLREKGWQVSTDVLLENPRHAIPKLATEWKADLAVLGFARKRHVHAAVDWKHGAGGAETRAVFGGNCASAQQRAKAVAAKADTREKSEPQNRSSKLLGKRLLQRLRDSRLRKGRHDLISRFIRVHTIRTQFYLQTAFAVGHCRVVVHVHEAILRRVVLDPSV
jgi:hypothetical protein